MINQATEASEEWNTSDNTLQEYITQYKELKLQMQTGQISEEEGLSQIYDLQQQITSEYGNAAENVDLINGNLDTQLEKLREINSQKAYEMPRVGMMLSMK